MASPYFFFTWVANPLSIFRSAEIQRANEYVFGKNISIIFSFMLFMLGVMLWFIYFILANHLDFRSRVSTYKNIKWNNNNKIRMIAKFEFHIFP